MTEGSYSSVSKLSSEGATLGKEGTALDRDHVPEFAWDFVTPHVDPGTSGFRLSWLQAFLLPCGRTFNVLPGEREIILPLENF